MTTPVQTIASVTLHRHGRHEYRVAAVITAAGDLALARQWGPLGAPGAVSYTAMGHAPVHLAAAAEALLTRLHGRGYVAVDDVAPLLDADALAAAQRLQQRSDAHALRMMMWPDADREPGASIADALFGSPPTA